MLDANRHEAKLPEPQATDQPAPTQAPAWANISREKLAQACVGVDESRRHELDSCVKQFVEIDQCIRACGFTAVESLKRMENGSNDSLRGYATMHLRRLAACANLDTRSIRKNTENEKFKLSLRQKGRCAGCQTELIEECCGANP